MHEVNNQFHNPAHFKLTCCKCGKEQILTNSYDKSAMNDIEVSQYHNDTWTGCSSIDFVIDCGCYNSIEFSVW